MVKILAIVAILGALAAGAYGSAASLLADGKTVQVGSDSTLVCDTDGVEVVSYQLKDHLDPMDVPIVSIKGIDAACDGARMGITVENGFGDMVAASKGQSTQWVIANGDENTVYNFHLVNPADRTQFISVPASDIYGINVWMEGDDTP